MSTEIDDPVKVLSNKIVNAAWDLTNKDTENEHEFKIIYMFEMMEKKKDNFYKQ
ncbi:5167_t:CDS:1, partial [Cetraspora pellucida]